MDSPPGVELSDPGGISATSNAAWVSFDEDKRGTIEPGKFADLAVIDRAYLDIPAEDIHTLKSVLTMMAGKVVHASDPFGTLKDK